MKFFVTSDHIRLKGRLFHVVQRVWLEIDAKYIDFVVSYNMKVKHNEYTDEIDIPANFRSLFKDKYSTPISSTPIENQSRPRHKIICNLQKYDKEE